MPLRSVEAASRDDAIAAAREQFGPQARVVGVRRVRSGGVLGFFATERYVAEVAEAAPETGGRPAVPAGARAQDDAPADFSSPLASAAPARARATAPARNGAAAWAAEAAARSADDIPAEVRAAAAAARAARAAAPARSAGPVATPEPAPSRTPAPARKGSPTAAPRQDDDRVSELVGLLTAQQAESAGPAHSPTPFPRASFPRTGSLSRPGKSFVDDEAGTSVGESDQRVDPGAPASPSPFTAALARMVAGDQDVRQAVQVALAQPAETRPRDDAEPWPVRSEPVRTADSSVPPPAARQEEETVGDQVIAPPSTTDGPVEVPTWAAAPEVTAATVSPREEAIADLLRGALAQGHSDEALAGILRKVLAGASPQTALTEPAVAVPAPVLTFPTEPVFTVPTEPVFAAHAEPMPAAPVFTVPSEPVPAAPVFTVPSEPVPAAPVFAVPSEPAPAEPAAAVPAEPTPAVPSEPVFAVPAEPVFAVPSAAVPSPVAAAPSAPVLDASMTPESSDPISPVVVPPVVETTAVVAEAASASPPVVLSSAAGMWGTPSSSSSLWGEPAQVAPARAAGSLRAEVEVAEPASAPLFPAVAETVVEAVVEAPIEIPVDEATVVDAPVEEAPAVEENVVEETTSEEIVDEASAAEEQAEIAEVAVVEESVEEYVEEAAIAELAPVLARTASDPAPMMSLDATTVMPPLSLLPPLPSSRGRGRPPVPPAAPRRSAPSTRSSALVPAAPAAGDDGDEERAESARTEASSVDAPTPAVTPAPAPATRSLATVTRLPVAPLMAGPEMPELAEDFDEPGLDDLLVDAPPAAAWTASAPPASGDVAGRLALLGVPAEVLGGSFADDVAERGTYAALTRNLALQLPAAPELPHGAGEALFVVGPGADALRAARSLAASLHLDPDSVQWATRGDLAGLASKNSRVTSVDVAIDRQEESAAAGTVTIVAVDAPLRTDTYWMAQMMTVWNPVAVWAVVEATRKPEDLEPWIDGLPRVDALIVQDTDLSADPAAVLRRVNAPVALLDGVRATPHRWASLLCERLESTTT